MGKRNEQVQLVHKEIKVYLSRMLTKNREMDAELFRHTNTNRKVVGGKGSIMRNGYFTKGLHKRMYFFSFCYVEVRIRYVAVDESEGSD